MEQSTAPTPPAARGDGSIPFPASEHAGGAHWP
jgi:hypothetical protein